MVTNADIPELDARGLRKFALMTGAIVGVLFGLFFPWLLDRALPLWPWVVTAVLGGWGLLAPASLRPVYRAWMRFGLLLNRIVSPLILGIVFFLVVTPAALIMKLVHRDSMSRKIDKTAPSYRIDSAKQPREKMEKPF